MKIKETHEKYCQYCGKKLERKRLPNGDLEYFIHFNKRKYCDRECMKRAFLKSGKSNQDWSSAHHTARKINELILHKEDCEKYGDPMILNKGHGHLVRENFEQAGNGVTVAVIAYIIKEMMR